MRRHSWNRANKSAWSLASTCKGSAKTRTSKAKNLRFEIIFYQRCLKGLGQIQRYAIARAISAAATSITATRTGVLERRLRFFRTGACFGSGG